MNRLGLARAVPAVVARPGLWTTAIRQWWRLVPDGWWRRPPFLPVPAVEYVRFRLLTQYGDNEHAPDAADVVNYLTWCRSLPQR